MKLYRPYEFAKLISKSVSTLIRWDREETLKACRSKTNRRYYTHDQYLEYIGQKANPNKEIIVYYRVSSNGQKNDLESQKEALEKFCTARGYAVLSWLKDIGSGLNYKRKNFVELMNKVEQGGVSKIVIAHKDRLVRFGFEWFEAFCQNHGTELIVMNNESLSPQEEMTQDLLSIIHCFSSRLYGLRKYKKKIIELAIKAEDENNSQEESAVK
ncbi:MAG: IS607 family transposase [Desulfobacterales bacterium]|nr:IS607 family transposase [Desulfobacterales bacterium]